MKNKKQWLEDKNPLKKAFQRRYRHENNEFLYCSICNVSDEWSHHYFDDGQNYCGKCYQQIISEV